MATPTCFRISFLLQEIFLAKLPWFSAFDRLHQSEHAGISKKSVVIEQEARTRPGRVSILDELYMVTGGV
jgi:hypothetical protein